MTDDLMTLTGDTFRRLAGLLDDQPASVWDAPSLCERWRVRDVVAHMSTAARYTSDQYTAELQADGGDFGVTTDRLAERDGRLEPAVLLANLRDEQLHRWTPPGGGEVGALLHAVVHGLDVTTPLDLPTPAAEPAVRAVLEVLATDAHAHFGVDLDGVALRAVDMDWTWGEGDVVAGSAADLALALAGRTIPSERVAGIARLLPT